MLIQMIVILWSYCLPEVPNYVVEFEVMPGAVSNMICAHVLPVSNHKEIFEVHLALIKSHVVRNSLGDDILPISFTFLLILEFSQLSNRHADSFAPTLLNSIGSILFVLRCFQVNLVEVKVDVFNFYLSVSLDQNEVVVEVY